MIPLPSVLPILISLLSYTTVEVPAKHSVTSKAVSAWAVGVNTTEPKTTAITIPSFLIEFIALLLFRFFVNDLPSLQAGLTQGVNSFLFIGFSLLVDGLCVLL